MQPVDTSRFARFPVLVVDDEQDNLDAFRLAFRRTFNLVSRFGEPTLALVATRLVATWQLSAEH